MLFKSKIYKRTRVICKMKLTLKQLYFLILIVLILFFYNIIFNENPLVIQTNDIKKLKNYDLILTKGQSIRSRIVRFKNDYSHIGILRKKKDSFYVLHSTPDGTNRNGVRFDEINQFIKLSSVYQVTILRLSFVDSSKNIQNIFSSYMQKKYPFDFEFNNKDINKLYCSELVYRIYNEASLLDSLDFNLEEPIYPEDFIKSNKFKIVKLNQTCH